MKPMAWLYGGFLAVIFILAYSGLLPVQLAFIPHYDTIGHAVLYGLAVYLGHRAFHYRAWQPFGYWLPLFPTSFTLFAIIEEFIQIYSPHRTFSWIDLAASTIGIVVGTIAAEYNAPKN